MQLNAISITQLLNKEFSTDIWLWEPYLPKVGIAALTGASDCGKSTLIRQLSLSVANSKETFLNSPLNGKYGKAICVFTEDSEQATKSVLTKQLTKYESSGNDNIYLVYETDNLVNKLDGFLKETKVDLICIDGWADTFSGNPNNFVEVRKNLNQWSNLATEHDCCMLLLHHNVKNSENSSPDKNKVNGSQGMEAKLRSVIELRVGQNSDERLLTITKGNYVPVENKRKSLVLKLHNESLTYSTDSTLIETKEIQKGKVKYDVKFWINEFCSVKERGISIAAAVSKLIEKYAELDVPSITWFKDNLKNRRQYTTQ
ncbi:MAG: AAA family ATPase [Flavipsychrobacter sp.]